MRAYLAKLRNDAAECRLISELATDLRRRDLFAKLADHYDVLASEIKRAIQVG
jgi:hypothetical protein